MKGSVRRDDLRFVYRFRSSWLKSYNDMEIDLERRVAVVGFFPFWDKLYTYSGSVSKGNTHHIDFELIFQWLFDNVSWLEKDASLGRILEIALLLEDRLAALERELLARGKKIFLLEHR